MGMSSCVRLVSACRDLGCLLAAVAGTELWDKQVSLHYSADMISVIDDVGFCSWMTM